MSEHCRASLSVMYAHITAALSEQQEAACQHQQRCFSEHLLLSMAGQQWHNHQGFKLFSSVADTALNLHSRS